ncbi:MAG: YHS domain-containing (seleno)protein [Pikeienuella sp.]
MFKSITLGLALAAGLSAAALAGPQYVDETGYAVSGYDVVAYHSLEQAPVGQPQPKAVPGRVDFTAEWNGAKWAFATAENRDTFLADPAKYAPAYDGHCAYGVAQGGKVPANPNLWRIVDGVLYLNINPPVVGFWEADIPGQIVAAQSKWSGLEDKPASERLWTSIQKNNGTYEVLGPLTN